MLLTPVAQYGIPECPVGTASKPNTTAKTSRSPKYQALRELSIQPERKSSLPLLWLVLLKILIISIAEDLHFGIYACGARVIFSVKFDLTVMKFSTKILFKIPVLFLINRTNLTPLHVCWLIPTDISDGNCT
jgi:hypothetical protein